MKLGTISVAGGEWRAAAFPPDGRAIDLAAAAAALGEAAPGLSSGVADGRVEEALAAEPASPPAQNEIVHSGRKSCHKEDPGVVYNPKGQWGTMGGWNGK